MTEDQISRIVLDCAIRVHSELGPGLLESVYEACLKYELQETGLLVESQKALPVTYRDVKLDCGFRLDLLVENKFIVEIKAVETLNDIHLAQIITYLKLSNCKLGFLLNFNVMRLKNGGIKRVANGM
jgi:GxxExxY protein